jgi:type IV secretory pathway protease TraF
VTLLVRHRALLVLILVGSTLALARPPDAKLAIINESPSLPPGLYMRAFGAQPALGAIVAVSPPPSTRPYLQSLGLPSEVVLLKRVAASGGDLVCADGTTVTAGERVVIARAYDRSGRSLPKWEGCAPLGPGEIFLLGDTAASFDSRYFGPVSRETVVGVFAEVFTW